MDAVAHRARSEGALAGHITKRPEPETPAVPYNLLSAFTRERSRCESVRLERVA